MGIKRPFEEETFPVPSFKQLKQVDCNINKTINTEEHRVTSWEVDSAGEIKNNDCELQLYGRLEDGDPASIADKEASAPLSLITSSSSEEDAGYGNTSFFSYLPGHMDSNGPRRPPKQFEDPYTYLLNCSPRKEVLVGPQYQAVLPPWNASGDGKELSCSSNISEHSREQKLMGACIIPMQALNDSSIDGVKVGGGRSNCTCPDKDSMRCIQQHIKEAREKLRETIGHEGFAELGFNDMGDEVAFKWTPDEEQVFHNIVFSNPVSQGRKFWKVLKAAFPTRTKRELVSYYFNVFMLHKRAVQNRSYVLEIDSDDDEEPKDANGDLYQNGTYFLETDSEEDEEDEQPQQGGHGDLFEPSSYSLFPDVEILGNSHGLHGECCLVGGEEDDDSTVETLDDQDLDASWVDDFWSEPQNNSGDIKDSNN